jgi:hypothetical protein
MSADRARAVVIAARVWRLGPICLLAAACSPQSVTTAENPDAVAAAPRPAAVEAPRIEPIPPIPMALRGCWDAIPPEDPEEPGGPHRLVVTAATIELTGEGLDRRVATAEFVERVTPTSIEGLFSAPEGRGRATIATALTLGDGGDRGPAGRLRRQEGDAGSSSYARCAR